MCSVISGTRAQENSPLLLYTGMTMVNGLSVASTAEIHAADSVPSHLPYFYLLRDPGDHLVQDVRESGVVASNPRRSRALPTAGALSCTSYSYAGSLT